MVIRQVSVGAKGGGQRTRKQEADYYVWMKGAFSTERRTGKLVSMIQIEWAWVAGRQRARDKTRNIMSVPVCRRAENKKEKTFIKCFVFALGETEIG